MYSTFFGECSSLKKRSYLSQWDFKNMKLSSEKIIWCILSRNKVTSSYTVIKCLFVNLIKINRCYIWMMFTKMHVTNYSQFPKYKK